MRLAEAIERIRLGEELTSIVDCKRIELCEQHGIDPEDAGPGQFGAEIAGFMRDLCRDLGERHAGEAHIGIALANWVSRCSDYEAWDSLLTSFDFEGRARLVVRGRSLFPGPLTAHWDR